ncbi:tRNA (guanosine(18)-2'-O)-methyltransferase TrmH [Kangiella sp. TOML190]|uniref:tRNA (guanosine(18)-2'-O)-methyltransferase TrmH n=1 Tax=Kangiella sp. TOML190 TaxID=2931351 RepID=UPI002040F321|nr:tRNA (guanosine(18)-2'-O)-methyltransferase TrmH [Kangiella sp. TOML190]
MQDQKPERLQKILQLVANRQPDLTVFMEQVHKPHNLAAIVRTADAVGIGEVHATFPEDVQYRGHHTASGSKRWVKTHAHDSLEEGLTKIRAKGMQLLSAHFSDSAVDFREIDYTRPTCLLVGSELVGVSEKAAALADQQVIIPMMGMVQSLNVSVATALILYEAQRQRALAGMYGQCKMPKEEVDLLIFKSLHPTVKKYCDRHQIRYPKLNEIGEIEDSDWDQLRKLV